MKKQLLLFAMILLPMVANAHDIEVQNADGVTIYYNYTSDGTELEVTFRGPYSNSYSNEYKGSVVIPEEVTYMGSTRKVTSISNDAFSNCGNLTSITIPHSVKSIGDYAFWKCSFLRKVIVPDIASWCGIKFGYDEANPLYYARHLYSDENTEIKDLIIPDGVTSIGYEAFYYCSGLTSVTISNSVTSIGEYAFYECSGLTSVTIGNSVTSIAKRAFSHCFALHSIIIPNSVTSIGDEAFKGNRTLNSVIIGNGVTSIGHSAFYDCYGLFSVTIGKSVTSISRNAFYNADISTIISFIEKPFTIYGKTSDDTIFSLNVYNNAMLYVPKGTIDKYKSTNGWMDFANIKEGNPTAINVVENTKDNKAVIYNLNGVRLSEPQKGIIVVNGRKYVKK
jgi:hypothetical protein